MYGCVCSLPVNRGNGCFVFISLGEGFGLLEPCPSGVMWTLIMTNSQWLLPWEGKHLSRNAGLHLVDLLLSSYFQFDTKFLFHCLLFLIQHSPKKHLNLWMKKLYPAGIKGTFSNLRLTNLLWKLWGLPFISWLVSPWPCLALSW